MKATYQKEVKKMAKMVHQTGGSNDTFTTDGSQQVQRSSRIQVVDPYGLKSSRVGDKLNQTITAVEQPTGATSREDNKLN